MEAGDLLVGNLAIASVVIKAIISSFRQVIVTSPLITRLIAVGLGIGTAFVMDAGMFSVSPESNMFVLIFNKIIAGMFIGVSAIGTHEAAKQLVKK